MCYAIRAADPLVGCAASGRVVWKEPQVFAADAASRQSGVVSVSPLSECFNAKIGFTTWLATVVGEIASLRT